METLRNFENTASSHRVSYSWTKNPAVFVEQPCEQDFTWTFGHFLWALGQTEERGHTFSGTSLLHQTKYLKNHFFLKLDLVCTPNSTRAVLPCVQNYCGSLLSRHSERRKLRIKLMFDTRLLPSQDHSVGYSGYPGLRIQLYQRQLCNAIAIP